VVQHHRIRAEGGGPPRHSDGLAQRPPDRGGQHRAAGIRLDGGGVDPRDLAGIERIELAGAAMRETTSRNNGSFTSPSRQYGVT
jgi:hypothetical protein